VVALNSRDLKQHLVAEGFQVFRVIGSHVILAERVRDNLIMDSGVAAVCSNPHAVRYAVRVRGSEHPGVSETELLETARLRGQSGLGVGYVEVESAVVPIVDPGDSAATLDTSYEVTYEKAGVLLAALPSELRAALSLVSTSRAVG
jgi:hypothetical protein